MNINMDDLRHGFKKKAENYANDKDKTDTLIKNVHSKAERLEKSGPTDIIYLQLQLLLDL